METKVCSKCKQELTIDSFNKNSSEKDKLHRQCRKCVGEYDKAYYGEYASKKHDACIKYRIDCKDRILEWHREHRENNRETYIGYSQKYRAEKQELLANLTIEQWEVVTVISQFIKMVVQIVKMYCKGINKLRDKSDEKRKQKVLQQPLTSNVRFLKIKTKTSKCKAV